jgi:hypothetical protein
MDKGLIDKISIKIKSFSNNSYQTNMNLLDELLETEVHELYEILENFELKKIFNKMMDTLINSHHNLYWTSLYNWSDDNYERKIIIIKIV